MKKQDTKEILKRMALSLMTFSPTILALLLLIASSGVKISDNLRFSLFTFLIGCTGAIIVVRKEIPMSLGSSKGKPAVIQGAIMLIVCWLATIYLAIYGLQ